MSLGKVYLVGAGVGDTKYLTQRGRQVLAQAEVLIYDALADHRLLELVPDTCLCLDMGKRGGRPSPPQGEIDRLLVAYCGQGRRVVRLKAGDPFIFGRSASELRALRGANCPVEVVPGISSALAAPLLAGIPLTDHQLSSGFAVLTGHDLAALDWLALARLPTLVFLMAGRNLGAICQALIDHGKLPNTPVALIRACGRPEQRVWTGTLETIDRQTRGENRSPTVMVIGEVVSLRDVFGETAMVASEMGLQGKTILVTRSTGQSSDFCDRLQNHGAIPLSTPALEIVPPSSWQPLDGAIAQLKQVDWLILTSSNGVEFFLDRLLTLGQDLRSLAHLKIAVVGKKTARVLKERGLTPDFIPPDFIADSLVERFPESVGGQTILFPRVETGGRDVLVRQFREAGATVLEAPAYESRCPEQLAPQALAALRQGTVDVVTFASSKTVRNFARLIEMAGDISLEGVAIASIGPQTSQSCEQAWGRCDIEAEEFTIEGLERAILNWAIAQPPPL